MAWLLAPAPDRARVGRVVARVDVVLGYPRVHAESELVRVGGGAHALVVRTETQCMVLVHATDAGVTALRGAVAISVDAVVDALRERVVDIDGVRKRIRQWIADRGWEVRADLPGVAERWSQVDPRDGAEGSPDGRPIPPEEDPEPDAARAGATR